MLSVKKTRQVWTATSFGALAYFLRHTDHDCFRRSCYSRSRNLESEKRDINTPEVREALDFLEPRIRPEWLIPQFRYHAGLNVKDQVDVDLVKKAQQQALLAIFPVIHESVKDLLGKQIDALVREFAATHDMKVKDEIERLAKEYGRLKEAWVFVAS
jgi:hypothetical protein